MDRTTMTMDNRRKYYSRYLAHYTKKHYGLLALGLLFLFGVGVGTLLLRTAGEETVNFLLQMVDIFLDNRQGQPLLENFLSGLMSSLLFLGVLFVCGFCAIAQPVIILLPLFRGLGVGLSIASIYASYGAQAIGYVALMLLPGTVLTTLAILLCSRESLRFSCSFWLGMQSKQHEDNQYPLRLYLARYLACTAFCCVVAFVEAVIQFGFSGLFTL